MDREEVAYARGMVRAHRENGMNCLRLSRLRTTLPGLRRAYRAEARAAFVSAASWMLRLTSMPLCPACVAGIGGAHAGPDAPWRPALAGEPCGAADHDGALS